MLRSLTCLAAVFALTSGAEALVFTDGFDRAWDSQGRFIDYKAWHDGQNDTSIGGWDGFIGGATALVAYNFIDSFPYTPAGTLNGVLLVSSKNGRWDQDGNSGVFLYKNVEGDFLAEVEIVSRDYQWQHSGGLMARVDNPTMDSSTENWISLSHFPVEGEGNRAYNVSNGDGGALGVKGYPPDPFLQLERRGDTVYLRTSPDGIRWTSLPGLEHGIFRADLPDALQIGIWQATFSNLVGTMMFDNFSMVPEPATVALLGLGTLSLVCVKKRS